jgi:threonine dehydrogenase-like Zn-dependent dehydrogenase
VTLACAAPSRAPAPNATMRAACLVAPGRVELREIERPPIAPHEVRIRLEGSGVCHSNLALWEGRSWLEYPAEAGAPGHEGWGWIEDLGADVDGLAVGQRVATLSHKAYADYDVASADAVVPLPDSLASIPMPGEPLGCAMNIFRRSAIAAGQTVVVVGIGFLGALLTRLASDAGARVIAISRRPFALEVACAFGAAHTIALGDGRNVIDRVGALTGGELAERVIEATGEQTPLDLAGELTRERGRLVIAGYHQDGSRQVNMQLWNWRGLDVINAHERDPRIYVEGMRAAVAAVVAGLLDPGPLCTHRYPLDALASALDATRDRPDGFMKALVMP